MIKNLRFQFGYKFVLTKLNKIKKRVSLVVE